MPHKITLTGTPITKLKPHKGLSCFDMEEAGSPNAPKGLPMSTKIRYTVLANEKQLKKTGITNDNIKEIKLLVMGEPTLDLSLDVCTGEIGIICFQIRHLKN